MLIRGSLYLFKRKDDIIPLLMNPMMKTVCFDMDETSDDLMQFSNTFKSTILLPPANVMFTLIDGNIDQFRNEYESFLHSEVVCDFMSAVLYTLYSGVNAVFHIPEEVEVAVNLPHLGISGLVPVAMLCMVFCGLCTSVMWGCIFNLSTEGIGKYTPMATGIFMALVCGGGIIPFVQGLVADVIGAQASYIVLACGLFYIFCYALWGSKNVNVDIKID